MPINPGDTHMRKRAVVGKIRRTQLVTSFGPGAIVDLPDHSVIMASTQYWKTEGCELHEKNLQDLLEVSSFNSPYCYVSEWSDEVKPDVPAFRFPYMHFCPSCHRLEPFWNFGRDAEKGVICGNRRCKKKIVPSRFVAACINGHIEDFPYQWWVHSGDFSNCPFNRKEDQLEILFSDETGGLDSIIIHCKKCGARRSMAGCMSKEALRGYHCAGKRPWIGMGKEFYDRTTCSAKMRTMQRGASNVYFSVTQSALTIPPFSGKIQQEIDKQYSTLQHFFSTNPAEEIIRIVLEHSFFSLIQAGHCSLDDIILVCKRTFLNQEEKKKYTKQDLMEDEYRVFLNGNYERPDDTEFRIRRTEVPEILQGLIEDVILAKRLREVLALKGFKRIAYGAESENDERFEGFSQDKGYVPLADTDMSWLPAIEMHGEGIFIRLNEEALKLWEDKIGSRYDEMKRRLDSSYMECENFSPRYVLLHTLSHLLIRQLSIECGYSGASVKERLYSTYPGSDLSMSGILLYTSSTDSDGSLGGLVRNGHKENFEKIFRNMLQDASWCSSDPVCIESLAQGVDSLNYAACHACTLLPETCCEMRNCLLDRASVVGTFGNKEIGFFSRIINEERSVW